MADKGKKEPVTMEELMVNNIAVTDALAKLLIAKGGITQEEFNSQVRTETANYIAVLKRMN